MRPCTTKVFCAYDYNYIITENRFSFLKQLLLLLSSNFRWERSLKKIIGWCYPYACNYSLTDHFYILDTKSFEASERGDIQWRYIDCKTALFFFHELLYSATFLEYEKIETEMKWIVYTRKLMLVISIFAHKV